MHERVSVGGIAGEALPARLDELDALYRLSDRLFRALSPNDVHEAALDAIQTTLGCSHAAIVFPDQDAIMRLVAWRGFSEGDRKAIEGHSPWPPGARDPRPIFVPDVANPTEIDRLGPIAGKEGIRALAFIPLVAEGTVIGEFITGYEVPHAFSEHEGELASTIARQIGFSLERARAEEARRVAEDRLRESEERFRLMSENAPVLLWMSDANGACLHLNRALREFWNVREHELAGFDWRRTMHPDDASDIGRRMMDALQTQSSVTITGRYLNREGQYRILLTEARPRFSAAGDFLGMLGVNVDMTERIHAERALATNEARLRRAHTAGGIGDWEIDLETAELIWSDSQYALLGVPRTEAPLSRAAFDDRIHPDDRADVARVVEASMRSGRFETEFRVLMADGRYHWLAARGEVHFDAAGRPKRMTGINFDVTGQREAAEQQKLLIDELNHRVKNTLAMVQSFAALTLKNASPEEFSEALMGRILALASAHDLLTRSRWSGASLEELVSAELAPFNRLEPGRIVWEGEGVALSPKQALGLGMVIHELVTNAAKHGALSVATGRVSLRWRCRDDVDPGRLEIVWSESGGPPLRQPSRAGFGSRLISQTIATDLMGTIDTSFDVNGLSCSISIPCVGT